ncbi:MAG: DegV family protein [Rhodocyclaceae bacterium]|nr:DegV family protein [Rhodocyclaceae bacterium]MCL4758465.1 DegV family protein [Rhodocyclaceae bacterium]
MATSIGLLVDATCDLPHEFFRDHEIGVLPVAIRIGQTHLEDRRDPLQTAEFYRQRYDRRDALHAETHPMGAAEVAEEILGRWATECDHVICMTVTAARSGIFSNTTRAAVEVSSRSRDLRRSHGLPGRCTVTVINTRSMFAGQGVLAWEAARLREAGGDASAMAERLAMLADHLHCYFVASDLYYLLHRAAKRGDTSVNWTAYAVGKALDLKPILLCHQDNTGPVAKSWGFNAGVRKVFDNTLAQVEAGLLVPCVCVSYGGDLAELEKLSGFAAFRRRIEAAGVELLVCQMSKTGAVNVGAGGLSVAFAAERHKFS